MRYAGHDSAKGSVGVGVGVIWDNVCDLLHTGGLGHLHAHA